MKKGVILCVALLVALVHASPLGLDSKKDENQGLKVVDIPAGVFDEPAEKLESVPDAAKDEVKSETIDAETVTPIKTDTKGKDEVTKDEDTDDSPSIFGIRFPSIVIFRRPAVIRDPFASFQSPFFSRPSIFSSPFDYEDNRETEVVKDQDQKPLASESDSVEATKVPTSDRYNNVMNRMHQQINNLFSSLFNPNNFPAIRPTFSRPNYSRPSLFSPFAPGVLDSEESMADNIDFGKLPPNYSNSTSETKLIDGQLVTVNKTIHKVSGNNSNGFFQYQVIKIGPTKPENEVAENPSAAKPPAPESEIIHSESQSVTSTKHPEMNPALNEVDRPEGEDKDAVLPKQELETKYAIDSDTNTDSQQETTQEEIKIVPFMPAKLIKASDGIKSKKISDLSSDIRVNNMMADNVRNGQLRALYDPDEVEVFDV